MVDGRYQHECGSKNKTDSGSGWESSSRINHVDRSENMEMMWESRKRRVGTWMDIDRGSGSLLGSEGERWDGSCGKVLTRITFVSSVLFCIPVRHGQGQQKFKEESRLQR